MKKPEIFYNIDDLFEKLNIQDKNTLSFHHHLRNGDKVLNMVLKQITKLGLKNMHIAPSSIFPSYEIAPLIKDGTITNITTNYINGPAAKAVSEGYLQGKLIMQTHGGRPRSIEAGELKIDYAFIATPTATKNGDGNGTLGVSACGALGYIINDMKYAKTKIIVTDNLVDSIDYIEIEGKYIDYILVVDSIGDPKGIVSGTTQITKNPVGLKIANDAAKLIDELGFIKDGFSFQTGAGGTSLAVADKVKTLMKNKNVKGSFASGGITGYLVEMLEEGLFEKLYDVQCFDLEAVRSYRENKNHIPMSAKVYADPNYEDNIVNKLDVVILGATEVDIDFNVNVTTDSFGNLMGGSGGHSDTAFGSKLSIITTPLLKTRLPIIKEKVTQITTPGSTIDAIVTERGIAINPNRTDLLEKLKDTKLNIVKITDLLELAYKICGVPKQINKSNDIIGYIEYRDGSILDTIYKPL